MSTYKKKYWIAEIFAYLVSIGIPVATTLIVYPDSVTYGATTHVSMAFILTIIVSLTAFRKKLSKLFENSPVIVTWIIILVISVVLKNFADEMFIIAISGVAGSAGSIPLFNVANKNAEKIALLKEELTRQEIATTSGSGAVEPENTTSEGK